MLENSTDCRVVAQDYTSNSISNDTDESQITSQEYSNFIESLYNSIFKELIDDAILDVCFEFHRNIKSRNFSEENSESKMPGEKQKKDKAVPRNKTVLICCPVCEVLKGTNNFSRHLDACMKGQRCRRETAQTNPNVIELDSEDEEEKSNKKSRNKKTGNSKKHTKFDFKSFTPEEKEVFFATYCGVQTKKSKTMCKNPRNCSRHSDDAKVDIRRSNNISYQTMNDEEIDIDTLDDNMSQSISMPSQHIDH